MRAVGSLLLFVAYAFDPVAASAVHIGGQPFKAHRLSFGSATAAGLQAEAIEHAEPTLLPEAHEAHAPVAPAMPPAPRPRVTSDEAYLPLNGAVPIRFVAARGWPPPLSPPQAEPGEPGPSHASPTLNPEPSRLLPQGAAQVVSTPPAPTAPEHADGQFERMPETVGAPTEGKALLTADLVLGYMGDFLNHPQGAHVRFKPAMPASAHAAQHVSVHTP